MFHKLMFVALLALSAVVNASPFLGADVPAGTADTCVYTRGTAVNSPVVVDAVNGNPALGNRMRKIDLAADPKTGTVTLALRDSILGVTGTATSYSFGVPGTPLNIRVIP